MNIRAGLLSIFISLTLTLAWAVQVYAIPTLQLYMPDGVYAESRAVSGVNIVESWLTLTDPFSLVVAGATQPDQVDVIKDVTLWIAIQKQDYENNPSGDIIVRNSDNEVISPVNPSASFGKPAPLSPHGIYDAYYMEYSLPDLEVASAGEAVYDYNKDFNPYDPGTSDTGDLQFYTIEYSDFFWLHLDLSGTAWDLDKHHKSWERFAPYSHDADAPPGASPVPEPSTFLFFLVSLVFLILSCCYKIFYPLSSSVHRIS